MQTCNELRLYNRMPDGCMPGRGKYFRIITSATALKESENVTYKTCLNLNRGRKNVLAVSAERDVHFI